MAKYSIEDTTMINIANAIRGKDGTTDAIPVASMAERIAGLPSGGEWKVWDDKNTAFSPFDAPGYTVLEVDLTGVDLTNKKIVLFFVSKTQSIILFALARSSTDQEFAFRSCDMICLDEEFRIHSPSASTTCLSVPVSTNDVGWRFDDGDKLRIEAL